VTVVRFWGTRGSLASPGADTARYGGNTSCVEVRDEDGAVLVLDAGTGIRALGTSLPASTPRVDVLLTHLHMDHIQGLGFFAPLYRPDAEVHIWGPSSTTLDLRSRLVRYLSPPFFPVHLRDLNCRLHLHEVPHGEFEVGPFRVSSHLVCHPGPTVGFRITGDTGTVTYLPDHEPALGARRYPDDPAWTSGFALAEGADLLIHDAQYDDDEYADRVGWGHASISQTLAFARLARVKELVLFHHDPAHSDEHIDRIVRGATQGTSLPFAVHIAGEGASYPVGGIRARARGGRRASRARS